MLCASDSTRHKTLLNFLGGAIKESLGMNTLGITRLGAVALLFCAQITSAATITFTHDATIGIGDFSNDGRDIIVTNCTLTVDGQHGFRSLQVLGGAVLTHSAMTNGAG